MLEYEINENYYVFINQYQCVSIDYLKGCSLKYQKEFLPIKESILEDEEYKYYSKFKKIMYNEEKTKEEKRTYKRQLRNLYGEMGEELYHYF